MLVVKWQSLHQAADDCTTTANKLKSTIAELESDMVTLTANWDGEAKAAYAVCQAAWKNAADDLTEQLTTLGKAVTAAAELYHTTELNALNGIPGR